MAPGQSLTTRAVSIAVTMGRRVWQSCRRWSPFDQSHNLASMRTRDTEPAMLTRAVVPELFEEAMSLINPSIGAAGERHYRDAFDCEHDAPEAQRVRLRSRPGWIVKLRQLKPPVPIWAPHHDDVDLDSFEPVQAVHPRALDSASPSYVMPSAGKKALAGARSSTTMLTWSNLLSVMS